MVNNENREISAFLSQNMMDFKENLSENLEQ